MRLQIRSISRYHFGEFAFHTMAWRKSHLPWRHYIDTVTVRWEDGRRDIILVWSTYPPPRFPRLMPSRAHQTIPSNGLPHSCGTIFLTSSVFFPLFLHHGTKSYGESPRECEKGRRKKQNVEKKRSSKISFILYVSTGEFFARLSKDANFPLRLPIYLSNFYDQGPFLVKPLRNTG